jgi:AcrR family transcriptional regulator
MKVKSVSAYCSDHDRPDSRTGEAMTSKRTVEDPQQRRADAGRNIDATLAAAARLLARDPDASMSDIALEAGLGRVTVYGHFKSRAQLVEQVAGQAIDVANAALRDVDLGGDPVIALSRLVATTWDVTARSGRLLVAAERALPPEVVRKLHGGELEDRVRDFIANGQAAGAFRRDMDIEWLVAMFHAVVHTAATEVDRGRLDGDQAASVITATLLGVLGGPGPPRSDS